MKKYIIFITKNKFVEIDGISRILVGIHYTDPEYFDGYLGDYVNARQINTFKYPKTPFQVDVKKYGSDGFERLTLATFNTYEEAKRVYDTIVTRDFIEQSYTYNGYLGEPIKINQFNLKGDLVKEWESTYDASMFYGIPYDRFEDAAKNKYRLLDSYWSTDKTIRVRDRIKNKVPVVLHLYNKQGKWLREFYGYEEGARYLHIDPYDLKDIIRDQKLVQDKYYVQNKVYALFVPKCRRQLIHQTFYVYDQETRELIGAYKGKAVMNVIGCHSWQKIHRNINLFNGLYRKFIIATHELTEFPVKKELKIEVYDKYGNFIENIDNYKDLKEKYNISSSKLKNIQLGDKHFGDYIFKYSK